MEEVNTARKDFTEALQAELDSQLEVSNEEEQGSSNINIVSFLMDFLKDENIPEFKT